MEYLHRYLSYCPRAAARNATAGVFLEEYKTRAHNVSLLPGTSKVSAVDIPTALMDGLTLDGRSLLCIGWYPLRYTGSNNHPAVDKFDGKRS